MKRLLTLLLLLPLLAHAEMSFITLKHRNAETLIPLLQPVLDEGITISGRGDTLIINSKPWQGEELRALVEQLDTPLQSLMITVIQGGSDNHSALQGDVSGNIEQPRVRIYGTQKSAKEAVSQQLRVIEGEWATIQAGESIPLARQTTSHSPQGTTMQQSIEYKDVESGFDVRPRIHGDMVTLELRPFRAKRSRGGAGIIEQQDISTTVSGRVGEWITIGGVDEEKKDSVMGTIYSTDKKQDATHTVRLKVELLTN
jgi:type II secretory pathway component GspD/PulD (secretin)